MFREVSAGMISFHERFMGSQVHQFLLITRYGHYLIASKEPLNLRTFEPYYRNEIIRGDGNLHGDWRLLIIMDRKICAR